MKNGEIILCNNIKLDINFENVLSYTESQMVELCRNNQVYSGTKYTMMDPSINEIDIDTPYQNCIYANYVAFNNKSVGNKWYFGFITKVTYINPRTTRITFKLDVFSTWYERFSINKAFIEREHVDDDTVGKHTIPEGLETGDYVVSSYLERGIFAVGNQSYIVIGLSNLVENFPTPSENVYNGVFSGLTYYILENAQTARDFIKALMEAWEYDASQSIYCLFLIPREFIPYNDVDWRTGTIGGNSLSFGILPSGYDYHVFNDNLTLSVGTNLDNYTPVNNKLLCYPYNYCLASNNAGQTATYNFEDFLDGSAHFRIIGTIGVGCSIRMDPRQYKNGFYSDDDPVLDNRRFYSYGLSCGKFPTCSWNCDSFTNWLTTQATNIGVKAIASVVQTGIGVATGDMGNVNSGLANAVGTLKSVYDHSLVPDQVQGNINTGDILNSCGANGFSYYRMTIKKEYAAVLDQFFSRYGYRVNEVKTPNLNSRAVFNFIKVGALDELITGNIPASDLEEINSIFRKGVTIFHSYSNIGNYTVNNPIVTE